MTPSHEFEAWIALSESMGREVKALAAFLEAGHRWDAESELLDAWERFRHSAGYTAAAREAMKQWKEPA